MFFSIDYSGWSLQQVCTVLSFQFKHWGAIRNKISCIVIQGASKTLQTDNDTELKIKELEEPYKHYKINRIFDSHTIHPCQGAVKEFNKTVENALDDALYNHKEGKKRMKKIRVTLNMSLICEWSITIWFESIHTQELFL